jgi:hypothetical protein
LFRSDHYCSSYERTGGSMVKYLILLKKFENHDYMAETSYLILWGLWLWILRTALIIIESFPVLNTMVPLGPCPLWHMFNNLLILRIPFQQMIYSQIHHWILFSFTRIFLKQNSFLKYSTLNKIITSVQWVLIAHCLSFPSLWVLWQKLSMLVHVWH